MAAAARAAQAGGGGGAGGGPPPPLAVAPRAAPPQSAQFGRGMSAVLVPFLLAVADRLDVMRNRPFLNRAAAIISGHNWAYHHGRMRAGGWFPNDYVESATNDLFVRMVNVPIVPGRHGYPQYVEAGDQEQLLVAPNVGGGAGGGLSTVPSNLLETCLSAYATLHLQQQQQQQVVGAPAPPAPLWAAPLQRGVWSQAQATAALAARAAAANAAAPLAPLAYGPR